MRISADAAVELGGDCSFAAAPDPSAGAFARTNSISLLESGCWGLDSRIVLPSRLARRIRSNTSTFFLVPFAGSNDVVADLRSSQ
jgi:hypothetical protein